jgi:hypothetical protein
MAYLTIDELRIIKEHDLGGCPLSRSGQKDVCFLLLQRPALFRCDHINETQITATDDGQHWIRIEQEKTKV